MRSFVKLRSSRNGEITLSFTDEGKSCHSRDFYVSNMSFNAIREKNSHEIFRIYSSLILLLHVLDIGKGPKIASKCV